MDGWRLIATAPRDGTVVEVTAEEFDEIWAMRWNPDVHTPWSATMGAWETPEGEAIWSLGPYGDGGPTHWRPLTRH